MVKLKTEQEFKFGQTNVLPILGETRISFEGIIEAPSQEVAEQLEAMDIGFYILSDIEAPKIDKGDEQKDAIQPQVEKDEFQKTERDELNNEEDEDTFEGSATTAATSEEVNVAVTSEEKKEFIKELENKTLAELKELAKPFPSGEWRTLSKAPLKDYLISKF